MILLTTVISSIIEFSGAFGVALGCTIPLMIMWFLTDSKQTSNQERLHNNIEAFTIPLLVTFIFGMIIQVFRILGG